ncbi:MAG: hypothetical protein WD601_02570 [Pseudohongiellaceae bacterium]
MAYSVWPLQQGAQATGYIKLDGVDGESKAASGQATGKRQHKPLQVIKPIDKNRPQKLSKSVKSKEEEPEPTGLLLPAIQKAR